MYFTLTDKLKLIKAVSNNLLGALWPERGTFPPAIVWLMTFKCNATCHHCDFWKRGRAINESDIMLIAQKIAKSDTFIVNLSGGEIFLVPNIREVITLLKKAGKYIRINSNGLIIGDFLDFLLKARVDSIAISIDHPTLQEHDANRGRSGAFEKCLKAIDYIKTQRTGQKPEISVRCVLMKNNIDQIAEFVEFFSSKVDDIYFQPIHDQTEKHRVTDPRVLFQKEDEPCVREVIDKMVAKHAFLNNAYFRNFPDFIFHPERLREMAVDFCLPVLFNTLMINPEGECYVCDQLVGNALREDLAEVWDGPRRKLFLKELVIKKKCSSPCWLNSNSARTAMAGGVVKWLIKAAR